MSFPAYEENVAKRAALGKNLKSIFDEAGPDVDLSKVKSIPGGPEPVLAEIQRLNAELDALVVEFKTKLEPVYKASLAADENPELVEGETSSEPQRPFKSFGQMIVESQAFKGFKGGQGPTATIGPNLDIRNTLFSTTAGWAPESTRTGIVTLSAQRPAPHVVDFIPTLPTSQSLVKFMRETTFTNNAAEAAEGAAYGEAALALTEASDEVEKIAVWLPVTDEQLEDEQAAAGYVDQRLVYMIRARLDSQVLNGNGTSPNLLGTDALASLQTQALGTDSIPDAIYKLFTTIRSVGFAEPSVVFIEPDQWQVVRLLKTADGVYIWGHPSQSGPEQIWGVPVLQTMACPANQVITGDYLNFSNLYVRRGVDVQITNSHASDFINGKQAIRADMRVAMVHYRINAFGQVTGL